MGACYSKAGHDASVSSRHKAPKEKNKNNTNGNLKHSIDDRTDKIGNGSVTLGIPSQNSGFTEKLAVDSGSCNVCSSKERDSKSQTVTQNVADVVTSDSGIGSFLPPEEHSELIDTVITPADDERTSDHDIVWQLQTDETKCNGEHSFSCSDRAVNRAKWLHKLGECKTHLLNPETKRNSDVIIIKRGGNGNSQSDKFRLSLNSTDSLDWNRFLTTSLDRAQSQASERFYNELGIQAPLAQFDSIDFLLSNNDLLSKNNRTNSYVDYNSDTFQFKFDFSGLEMAREAGSFMDEDDIDVESAAVELSEAEYRLSQFSLDSENIGGDFHVPVLEPSDISLQDLRHFDSEASLELPSILPNLSDIQTMKLDGQDVVVMDVESFSQIVEEISSLKQKLSQLTAVILEDGSISCRSSLSGIMSH